MTWYAIHVYDYNAGDALVLDVIRPLADRPRACFFIRYWEGGPHIRFRVDLPGDEEFAGTLDDLRARAAAYFATRPKPPHFDDDSFRDAQRHYAEREGRLAPSRLVPHGAIRPEPYRPEYTKYGGPAGVAVAERLFCRSSAVVLDALPTLARDPVRRRVAGLAMMLGGLRAVGMDRAEAVRFFDGYWRYWSGYVPAVRWSRWWDGALTDRHGIAAAVRESAGGTRPPYLAAWEAAVRSAAVAGGELLVPPDRSPGLVHHFLHTHNNRLGIPPVEEAYLAVLALHTLDAPPRP